jgi:hypothetical protein
MFKTVFSVGLNLLSFFLKGCSLPDGMKSGYKIEKGEVVIYTGFPAQRMVIEVADADTFEALNKDCGKDGKHVFLLGKVIPNADPATFRLLGGSYSKDKNHGYTRDVIVSDDAANFTIVPNRNETASNVTAEGIVYARDSHFVYEGVLKIERADPTTFEFIPMFNGYYVCRDKKTVYWQHKPLEGTDGQSFVKITELYFKDKNHAWALILGREVTWSIVPNADAATFIGLKKAYSKDKKNVYYETRIVEGADPETFEETENNGGKDKNGNYQSGVPVPTKN